MDLRSTNLPSSQMKEKPAHILSHIINNLSNISYIKVIPMPIRILVPPTCCGKVLSSLQSWDDVCSHDDSSKSKSAFLSECTPGHTKGINPVLSKDQLYGFFYKVKRL